MRIIVKKDKRLTSLAAIMLLLCILFSLSSCEVEDIGRIGRGIITGQKVDKYRAPEIVPNDKNFVVVEGQEGQSVMKYTLTSAYETDDISKAGLSRKDFWTDRAENYLGADGRLNDESQTIVVLEMVIEKLTDQTIAWVAGNTNIHYLPTMSLYKDSKFKDTLSPGEVDCFYLEQTEDITRSDEERSYYQFFLKKGQTAKVKLAYIIPKENLQSPEMYLYVDKASTFVDGELKDFTYYIQIKLETEETQ